jgi:hypothetical protein
MAEQNDTRDMTDQSDRQDLEDRVEQLEGTIAKMLPGRRDALKLGGAALVGGAAMSGSASAGTQQAGTIGTSGAPVDVESEDINNADTVTTENLVVNNSATGPFGGGIVLEAGDTITVATIANHSAAESFVNLYNGVAKDVLGGVVAGFRRCDFLYTFSNGTTLRKNGTGTSYSKANPSNFAEENANDQEVDFLPPAKDVTKIDVGSSQFSSSTLGAEVILRD